jgi:hypothetical protein
LGASERSGGAGRSLFDEPERPGGTQRPLSRSSDRSGGSQGPRPLQQQEPARPRARVTVLERPLPRFLEEEPPPRTLQEQEADRAFNRLFEEPPRTPSQELAPRSATPTLDALEAEPRYEPRVYREQGGRVTSIDLSNPSNRAGTEPGESPYVLRSAREGLTRRGELVVIAHSAPDTEFVTSERSGGTIYTAEQLAQIIREAAPTGAIVRLYACTSEAVANAVQVQLGSAYRVTGFKEVLLGPAYDLRPDQPTVIAGFRPLPEGVPIEQAFVPDIQAEDVDLEGGGSAPAAAPATTTTMVPTRASVRALLDQVFLATTDLEAFTIDYFYESLPIGRDLEAAVQRIGLAELLAAARAYDPEQAAVLAERGPIAPEVELRSLLRTPGDLGAVIVDYFFERLDIRGLDQVRDRVALTTLLLDEAGPAAVAEAVEHDLATEGLGQRPRAGTDARLEYEEPQPPGPSTRGERSVPGPPGTEAIVQEIARAAPTLSDVDALAIDYFPEATAGKYKIALLGLEEPEPSLRRALERAYPIETAAAEASLGPDASIDAVLREVLRTESDVDAFITDRLPQRSDIARRVGYVERINLIARIYSDERIAAVLRGEVPPEGPGLRSFVSTPARAQAGPSAPLPARTSARALGSGTPPSGTAATAVRPPTPADPAFENTDPGVALGSASTPAGEARPAPSRIPTPDPGLENTVPGAGAPPVRAIPPPASSQIPTPDPGLENTVPGAGAPPVRVIPPPASNPPQADAPPARALTAASASPPAASAPQRNVSPLLAVSQQRLDALKTSVSQRFGATRDERIRRLSVAKPEQYTDIVEQWALEVDRRYFLYTQGQLPLSQYDYVQDMLDFGLPIPVRRAIGEQFYARVRDREFLAGQATREAQNRADAAYVEQVENLAIELRGDRSLEALWGPTTAIYRYWPFVEAYFELRAIPGSLRAEVRRILVGLGGDSVPLHSLERVGVPITTRELVLELFSLARTGDVYIDPQ